MKTSSDWKLTDSSDSRAKKIGRAVATPFVLSFRKIAEAPHFIQKVTSSTIGFLTPNRPNTEKSNEVSKILSLGEQFKDEAKQKQKEEEEQRRKRILERKQPIKSIDLNQLKDAVSRSTFSSSGDINFDSIQKLDNLYREMPSEWISKITPLELEKVYESVMACLTCPLSSNASVMCHFYNQEFRALKRAFNISDVRHKEIMDKVELDNQYLYTSLQDRIKNSELNPVYNRSAFDTEYDYFTWKKAEEERIKAIVDKIARLPEFSGNLMVTVLEARDLAVKDTATKTSDPFCELRLVNKRTGKKDKKKVKTKVVDRLNPIWNEVFNLELNREYEDFDLRIKIFDKDKFSANDYMGETNIPLALLSDQQKKDQWFSLSKTKKYDKHSVKGDVHLILLLTVSKRPSLVPPKKPIPSSEVTDVDHHRYYKELLLKLIQFENPGFLQRMDIKPLSHFFNSMLEEYSIRYGISEPYRHIVHLEILVEYFHMSKNYIQLILAVLLTVEDLKKTNSVMTIKENQKQLYKDVTTELQRQVENILTRYKHAFRISTMDGTLQLLVMIINIMNGKDERATALKLEKYIKDAALHKYELWVQHGEDDTMTPSKLLKIADKIIDSLEEDIQLFRREFPEYSDPAYLSAKLFRERIFNDVVTLFQTNVKNKPNGEIFDLYFKLEEINKFLVKNDLKIDALPVTSMYESLVITWLDNSRDMMSEWTQKILISDSWQPLIPDGDSPILHSSSVVDVFDCIAQPLKFLFEISFDVEKHVFHFVSKTVCKLLREYADYIKVASIKFMDNRVADFDCQSLVEIARAKDNRNLELPITKELCVRVNNLETVRSMLIQLSDFIKSKIESDAIETSIDETHRYMKTTINDLLEIITSKMNKDIQAAIQIMITKSPPDTDPLFAYLKLQWDILNTYMFAGTLMRLLKNLFVITMKDLELTVAPFTLEKDKSDRAATSKLVLAALPTICNFFCANGDGLTEEYVETGSTLVKKLCQYFDKTTSELISLCSYPIDESVKEYHILSILATKSDKEAKNFIQMKGKSITNGKLRKEFQLPETEEVFKSFFSRNSLGVVGLLYVTTSYLCFEPLIGNKRIQLPIAKMKAVAKAKYQKVFPTAIKIQMQDLEAHKFSGLIERDALFNLIIDRAKAIGNKEVTNKKDVKIKVDEKEKCILQ